MIVDGWRGPGWQVFDADPRCGKEVRRWLAGVVDAHERPINGDDVALVAGELFANAVMHGPFCGRVLVGYCLWRSGARIVVCDGGGGGVPRMRDNGQFGEGGWGLHVVESLSAAWGAFREGSAQVVWCDFAESLRVPDAEAWAWLRAVLKEHSLRPLRDGHLLRIGGDEEWDGQ